jgi:uncharacterized protein YkwD
MPRVRTPAVVLVVLTASALAVVSPAVGARAAERGSAVQRSSSLEQLVLREINAVRAARHLPTLSVSPALSQSAVAHSRAMATYGFFAHESRNGTSFSQRIKRFYLPRTGTWTVGENLAMFAGSPPTASAIVDAWMASPGHRANLLRVLFHEAGLAIMFNPAAGGVFGGEATWVVTLDLGSR